MKVKKIQKKNESDKDVILWEVFRESPTDKFLPDFNLDILFWPHF